MSNIKINFQKKLLVFILCISMVLTTMTFTSVNAETDTYSFIDGFSSIQGLNQWYYKEWNGSNYADMVWDSAKGRWQGSNTYCIIGEGWLHPDTNDVVLTWKAPKDGVVTIRGTMEHGTLNGDGTLTRIMKQNGSNVTQIWPSSGPQEIKPNLVAQHILQVWVSTNDLIYFHVNQNSNNAYDSMDWDPVISYNDTPEYLLDKLEPVMSTEESNSIGIRYSFDASPCIISNGTNFDFYHSEDGGTVVQKWSGTLDDPAQIPIYQKDPFTNPNNIDGNWWLTNIYKTSEGHLLAFCHLENCTSNGWWALGLAYSTDGGNTFQKLGKIVTCYVPDTGHNSNIFGVPYIIKDGYFYIYYQDRDPNVETHQYSVARALVTDVINAAQNGTVTQWKKYYNGAWNENGLGGNFSNIMPSDGLHDWALHGDAAYNSYLGKYILSGYTHLNGKGVWISYSTDGVNWEMPTFIQNSKYGDKNTISPYISIIDSSGSDNGVVGKSIYLYFNYRFNAYDMSTWKWLYRQKITFLNNNYYRGAVDFDKVQGSGQWLYKQWNGNQYSDMSWDFTYNRWKGQNTFCLIDKTWQHPDMNDSVRAWVAPRAGIISINAVGGGISVSNGIGADGVKVKILKNSENIWPASGWQTISAGNTVGFTGISDITVSAGDIIYFITNQNTNSAYDTTNWDPIITYQ